MSNIRYFVFSDELHNADDSDPIEEVGESEFLEYDVQIVYERHTVRENGVSQVCLTKYPDWFMSA